MRTFPLLAIFTLLPLVAGGSQQEPENVVEQIFDRIEGSNGAGFEEGCRRLAKLGPGVVPELREGLKRAHPYVRMAAARILYGHDLKAEAREALSRLVLGKSPEAGRAAANLLATLIGSDRDLAAREKRDLADACTELARESEDPLVEIPLWRTVWSLTETILPRRAIRKHLRSEETAVRSEAALALAEMGAFSGIRKILRDVEKEPGEKGRLAGAYLKLNELTGQYERDLANRADRSSKYDYRLLDELLDTFKTHYHDNSKIETEKMIEAAARGMCGSLDPYSAYYDEETIRRLKEEELGGRYGGIGARVSMQKDKSGTPWLTITEPIYSGPAYKSGLRSNDIITEVEGESSANKSLLDMVRLLRGTPDSVVTFKVMRRGWQKVREFKIKRAQIQLETTTFRMLPGSIGYIQLITFGGQDILHVKRAIQQLRNQGMNSLIFDLRGNSGGYLRTAIDIASYFLEKGKLILTTKGPFRFQDRRVANGGKLTDVPLFMLVDGGSASASEILAGALRDHDRAVLIGDKTFGKGSVQDLKYLKTTEKKTALRVTISKWFLPNGDSVENDDRTKSGVHPNIKVALPERDLWKEAEFDRIRASGELDGYMTAHFDKHRNLFEKLAESDGGDASRYPGFDELYASLETKADRTDVREVLRGQVRRRVQDERGKPLYFDFQTDVVLQRGIVEAGKKAGIDLDAIPEFATFVK